MDIKSLMVGDWVYNTYNRQNERVQEIGSGLVMLNYNDLYEFDEIEPIPLVPEILEKNGWTNVEVDGVFHPKQLKGELPLIKYATDGYNWSFRIKDFCEIKFVHQLQQALRLCKIEKEIEL